VLSGLHDVFVVESEESFSLTLVDGAALELALSTLELS